MLFIVCSCAAAYFILGNHKMDKNGNESSNPHQAFYTAHGLDLKALSLNIIDEEQSKNLQEINTILDQWEQVTPKYANFAVPESSTNSIYSFDITVDTFKNSFESLVVFAIKLNDLGAVNRTRIIISTLKDLIEDYESLCKVWKGVHGPVISTALSINGQPVLAPMECAWGLKIIFSLCPSGDSPKEIIDSFNSMIAASGEGNAQETFVAAHKVNLEKLDIGFITKNFGILSKVIDTNMRIGLLNKDDLVVPQQSE